jgi:hypothetical protein
MLPQLKRIRWGIRAVLVLGVAASTVANILHARENPISQSIAAWPPLALLITIEVISRVPVHRRALAVARLFAAAVIAGIAAWVSYWHMAGVASRYGEQGASPYLLPMSVDGLIVVASICLVELGGRIRSAEGDEVAHPVAQHPIEAPQPPVPSAPVFLEPVSAPPAPVEEAEDGAPATDEQAAQKVRQDARTAQQIEAAVRAMRASDPKLSQRKIADAVMVPLTTVRRILQRTPEPFVEPAEPVTAGVNGHTPALVHAGRTDEEES